MPNDYRAQANALLADFSISNELKQRIRIDDQRDPLDALNDAALLYDLHVRRWNAMHPCAPVTATI